MCCMSHSGCCAQTPDEKQLWGGGAHFGSQFKGLQSTMVEQVWWQEGRVAGHIGWALSTQAFKLCLSLNSAHHPGLGSWPSILS